MQRVLTLGLLLASLGPARDVVWTASWIDVANTPTQDYGVYHFRKTFELPAKPSTFVVHVSGDNRYRLYANGQPVSLGPARGDLTHWRYETVDLAPHLRTGKNVLAAVVWNDGPGRAVAQVTNQTGFLLQADASENALVNTGKSWQCLLDRAYTPQSLPASQRTGYYALAANERFDAAKYPWSWETNHFDDSNWQPAHEISRAATRDQRDAPNRWMLVAS
ncbi:MAG TPA: alpha-L-rhamnosidase N-terminal domain-containing protein [Bryobacteraceae bacterium]|nr:alpha-L-rhamnosidase N-terminal domain-containing protein [Bryobacteraceae bacterium]